MLSAATFASRLNKCDVLSGVDDDIIASSRVVVFMSLPVSFDVVVSVSSYNHVTCV